MRRIAPLLLTTGLFIPTYGFALGLGNIKVNSALDQPFNAEIQLLISNGRSPDVQVRLASDDDFTRLKIDRSYVLKQFTFSSGTDRQGNPIVRVTSKEPINEPYLNFVVELDSNAGDKLLRAYTVLLDPPNHLMPASHSELASQEVSASPGAPFVPKPVIAAETPASVPVHPTISPLPKRITNTQEVTTSTSKNESLTKTEIISAKSSDAVLDPPNHSIPSPHSELASNAFNASPAVVSPPAPKPVFVAETSSPVHATIAPLPKRITDTPKVPVIASENESLVETEIILVKPSDSLWKIANRVRKGTTLTSDQIMIAIAAANPNAFYSENINRLKTGVKLQIPSVKRIQNIDKVLANHEVLAQLKAWKSHTPIHHAMTLPDLRMHSRLVAKPIESIPNDLAPKVAATAAEIPTPDKSLLNGANIKREQPILSLKDPIKKGIEESPVLKAVSNTENVPEKKLLTQLALSVEESNRIKESNQVLQEELTRLQIKNQLLEKQLLTRKMELETLNKRLIRVESHTVQNEAGLSQVPAISSQAIAHDGMTHLEKGTKLLYSLLAVFTGGGILAGTVAFRRRRSQERVQSTASAFETHIDLPTITPIDLEKVDIRSMAGEDVVATQLDLATAYISMEDYAGAREILTEIKNAGTAEQQEETVRLLKVIDEKV